MGRKALVVIDLQNDITKNYKGIIDNVNRSIDWAVNNGVAIVYVRHENQSDGTRTFKHNTRGAEFVPEMKIVTANVFTKYKSNALTSEAFAAYLTSNEIDELYIAGADATACVKATVYNLTKANYKVNVLADCITSYDLKKIDEMLRYYADKSANILRLADILS